MRLGCTSTSYEPAFRAGRMDLRDWLRAAGDDLELDAVEIADVHLPFRDPATLLELRRMALDLHLEIASVAVTPRPGERPAEAADRVRRWCDVASYLGARAVVVRAPAPPPATVEDAGRVIGLIRRVIGQRGPDRRRLWSDAMALLRTQADEAAARGVALALRNAPGTLVESSQEIAYAVHDAGGAWLRAAPDPAAMLRRAGLDLALPRSVLAYARLQHVEDDGSDATLHWPEVLRVIRLGRFRGPLLIDYAGQEAPEQAVPRAARYLRDLLHLIERQRLLRGNGASAHDAGIIEASVAAHAP